MKPCSCCTCEGLSESRCHPKSRASGGFYPPCSLQEHVEAWCRGWFIKLDHPSIFHGSLDGQRKLLKHAEENQEVRDIVWASLVAAGHRQSSVLWAQVAAEEELGPRSPAVFQGNIMAIFLDAVKICWNNQYSILRKISTTVSFLVCPCTYLVQTRYVRVCTEYVLVCTNINQSTANLWVEGTSGIRVFASRCAPRNPVKQASVLYIQVCTGTHQVHTSICWSVSSTYLYILSICWYI
jgi:hypothetical protein